MLLLSTYLYPKYDVPHNTLDLYRHTKTIVYTDSFVTGGNYDISTHSLILYKKVFKLNDGYAILAGDIDDCDIFIELINNALKQLDNSTTYTDIFKSSLLLHLLNNCYEQLIEYNVKDSTISGFIYYKGICYRIRLSDNKDANYWYVIDPSTSTTSTSKILITSTTNKILDILNAKPGLCNNCENSQSFIDELENIIRIEISTNGFIHYPLYKFVFPSFYSYLSGDNDIIVNSVLPELDSKPVQLNYPLSDVCAIDQYTAYSEIYNAYKQSKG